MSAAVLAGCGGPTQRIVNSTPDGVSIAFDGSEKGLGRATEAARRECNRTGGAATLSNVSRLEDSSVASFECRPAR